MKIKHLLAIPFVFSLLTNSFGQNRSIHFEEGDWNSIVAKAQSANKPIFVDAYAVWCGPCKWMSATVFTNDSVADFYNENYVNVKMDMEKGEGIELAKKWEVRAYPTLIYFNSNGELMDQYCGAYPTQQFIEIGKNATNPDLQLATLNKRYSSGDYENSFLLEYVNRLAQSCKDVSSVIKEYFKTQPEESLIHEENWNLIYYYLEEPQSETFKYFETNQEEFGNKYGKELVEGKLKGVYINYILEPSYQNKFEEVEKRKLDIASKNTASSKAAINEADLLIFQSKSDWDNYISTANKIISSRSDLGFQFYNQIAWTIFEKSNNKNHLKTAANWAKKSIAINENVYNLDTYANILFVLGDKKNAISYQKKAVELAEKTSDPILDELKENLKLFEGKK